MYHNFQYVVFASLFMQAWTYPTGAHNNITNPLDALTSHCSSGNYRPNHGDNLPQASPSPYIITLNNTAGSFYKPGQPVTITIEGNKSPTKETFKGFFIQGDPTEASFSGEITCGSAGKQVNFCGKPGVTHVNAELKERVVCTWNPPDFQLGNIQFVATIVKNFTTFWTGVRSSSILAADPSTITYAEKSRQMREQMMRQFQQNGGASGSNPFAQYFATGK